MPAADLERLGRELATVDFDDLEEAPGDAIRADCFEYSVEYGDTAVTLDDLDQPAPALRTLLGHLGELASENYPPDLPARSGT